jgi:LssY C-terminus
VDGVLFAFAGVSTVWLAYLLLREGVQPGWPLLLLVGFWLVVTYLLLPRLHRILTRLYVPGYFIGRTRTSDGLLGDPVNLALLGTEAQVHTAMTRAGWTRADDLSLRTGRRIVTSTLSRRSYAEAPVSPLHLFDRQQDFAYQQEVAGSPSKRHHVRFWRCPEGWMLPGGYSVDWLAAGTYDRSVGLSLFTLQVTHKIQADTDVERDFIVASVTRAEPVVDVDVISNFSTGYHSRNGGGDLIETDGGLPIVDLRRVRPDMSLAPVLPTDSRDKRPAQITFGAGVALLRSATILLLALAAAITPDSLVGVLGPEASDLRGPGATPVMIALTATLLVVGLLDLWLGLAVLAGRNWARLLLMAACVVTTVGSFVSSTARAEAVTLGNLPLIGSSILVLLALSSHRARDYTARGRPVRKRVTAEPK